MLRVLVPPATRTLNSTIATPRGGLIRLCTAQTRKVVCLKSQIMMAPIVRPKTRRSYKKKKANP